MNHGSLKHFFLLKCNDGVSEVRVSVCAHTEVSLMAACSTTAQFLRTAFLHILLLENAAMDCIASGTAHKCTRSGVPSAFRSRTAHFTNSSATVAYNQMLRRSRGLLPRHLKRSEFRRDGQMLHASNGFDGDDEDYT